MLKTKNTVLAILLAAFIASYPQNLKAEVFKSSEFLTWKYESQAYYLRTSIGMAGLIISRNNEAQGKCLDDWYLADQKAANEYILSVMRDYPDYHPRGTLAAIIEKKCGSLKF